MAKKPVQNKAEVLREALTALGPEADNKTLSAWVEDRYDINWSSNKAAEWANIKKRFDPNAPPSRRRGKRKAKARRMRRPAKQAASTATQPKTGNVFSRVDAAKQFVDRVGGIDRGIQLLEQLRSIGR